MVCPYCCSQTCVTNSRPQEKSRGVWRRRCCCDCGQTFTTQETVVESKAFVFEGKDGHVEPFSRDKLLISMYDSLKHRKSAVADASALVDTVLGKVLKASAGPTIKRDLLTNTAANTLKQFDKPAQVHYLAYFKK